MEKSSNGRWTQAEHEAFLTGIKLYGKNWKKIQTVVGTRTGSQIRSHAQKFFMRSHPNMLECEGSEEEIKEEIDEDISFLSQMIKKYSPDNTFDFWTECVQTTELKIRKASVDSLSDTLDHQQASLSRIHKQSFKPLCQRGGHQRLENLKQKC